MSDGGATGAPPPLIDYPTFYPFKAMGLSEGLRARVVAIIEAVVGSVEDHAVSVRPSATGKYESITVQVYLKSEDERRRVYAAFHADKAIVWYV